jgi:hypothetical protein
MKILAQEYRHGECKFMSWHGGCVKRRKRTSARTRTHPNNQDIVEGRLLKP